MIVIPLVFASIVTGLTSSESMEQLKQLGIRVIVFFILTAAIAISIGIGMAYLIQPGQFISPQDGKVASLSDKREQSDLNIEETSAPDLRTLPDYLVDLLPKNPLGAMVEGQMLQIVLFAIIFGLALVTMPSRQAQPLLDFLGSIQQVSMTVVRWAMLIAPLAVFGLIAQTTIHIGIQVLWGMMIYVITVLGGLLILLVFYLLLLFLWIKQPPLDFLAKIKEVMLLAFSTSSSAAVMPLSLKTAEDHLKVSPSVARFVIPLGATINMDGTALYQGVAAIFLAQVFGIELSIPALLLIVVTAVGASIGTPATPGVGIVVLASILNSAGIPAAGIALILGVDRILDMSRTAVNVTGDLTASMIMDRLLNKK